MNQPYRQNYGQRTNYSGGVEKKPLKTHEILTEDNYVELAEKAIDELIQTSQAKNNGREKILTTSKIRNLLAMTADIYNDVILSMEEELPADVRERINYLKVRFIYESGRVNNDDVKKLVNTADILRHLQDIGNSRKRYLLFSRYMEALVAYQKYLAGDRVE